MKKGAPPPPENLAEVRHALHSKFGLCHVLITDAAQAYPAVAASAGAASASVNHIRKQFSRFHKFNFKPLWGPLQDVARARAKARGPTDSTPGLHLRVCSNMVEGYVGVVKAMTRRRRGFGGWPKGQSSAAHASAYLLDHSGMLGVARAVRNFVDFFVDRADPRSFASSCAASDPGFWKMHGQM